MDVCFFLIFGMPPIEKGSNVDGPIIRFLRLPQNLALGLHSVAVRVKVHFGGQQRKMASSSSFDAISLVDQDGSSSI
jgi:hypothetical protein